MSARKNKPEPPPFDDDLPPGVPTLPDDIANQIASAEMVSDATVIHVEPETRRETGLPFHPDRDTRDPDKVNISSSKNAKQVQNQMRDEKQTKRKK